MMSQFLSSTVCTYCHQCLLYRSWILSPVVVDFHGRYCNPEVMKPETRKLRGTIWTTKPTRTRPFYKLVHRLGPKWTISYCVCSVQVFWAGSGPRVGFCHPYVRGRQCECGGRQNPGHRLSDIFFLTLRKIELP